MWSKCVWINQNITKFLFLELNRLIISDANQEDSGRYRCEAANEYSSDSGSVDIRVAGKWFWFTLVFFLRVYSYKYLAARLINPSISFRRFHPSSLSGQHVLRQLRTYCGGQVLHAQVLRKILLSIVHRGRAAAGERTPSRQLEEKKKEIRSANARLRYQIDSSVFPTHTW